MNSPSKYRTLENELAYIIANTKRKNRSSSIPEIASAIGYCLSKIGGYSTLSDRVGLSETMLRQFTRIHNLDLSIQNLFKERILDSVDVIPQLAQLSIDDQRYVAEQLSKNTINTKDVRAVREIRKRDKSTLIEEIVRHVETSKSKKVFVAEFVLRGGVKLDAALNRIGEYISKSNIIDASADGALAKLTLNEDGNIELRKTAKKLGVTIAQVINHILF